jgi:hypothetical protein
MEETKPSVELNNYSSIYLNRLMHYAGYGALVGGVASMLFLMRFKRGFVFGLGLGAGYCHSDLIKVYKAYFNKSI